MRGLGPIGHLATEVVAVDAVDLTAPYVCPGCGFRGIAKVIASGSGMSLEPVTEPDKDAARAAAAAATKNAEESARRWLARTRYPSCNALPAAGRRARLLTALGLAAVFVGLGSCGGVMSLGARSALPLVLTLMVWTVIVGRMAFRRHEDVRKSRGAVTIEPDDRPESYRVVAQRVD